VHLEKEHGLSLEDYTVQYLLEEDPKCACGLCDERPQFKRGKFLRYAKGHESFKKREELWIVKFGEPKCKECGSPVKFRRGHPQMYCSFSCSGKNTGFSLETTQERIKEVVQERYGVDNVFQLPEVIAKITESRDNEAYAESMREKWKDPDFKERMRQIASDRWLDEDYKKRVSEGISKSIKENPEEIKRRSEYMKIQMQDEDFRDLSFSSIPNRLSKLHLKIREELDLESKGFVSEQRVGRYLVDELNEETKTIIEINGDYVHANPQIYSEDDIIRMPGNSYTAAEKWESDSRKIDSLRASGYEVLIIWESTDLCQIKSVLNQIQEKRQNQLNLM